MMKKISAVLLSLVVVLSVVAAAPFTVGAETEYKLWVNNEQITSSHLTVQCGGGTATFNPDNYTLTLDNAEITQGAEIDYLGTGILTFLDRELTIVVNGVCAITETGGDGIGCYEFDDDYNMVPHDITVTGDGMLTIDESTPVYGYGFYCTGKLTLDGVFVTVHSEATGIWAKELTIKNDCCILSQCQSQFSGIVVNNGDFRMDSGSVTAESTRGVGLLLGNDREGAALIQSGGELALRGQAGIAADNDKSSVTVTGGTLNIEAVQVAMSEFVANNVTLGAGVSLVEGDYDQTAVVISGSTQPQFKLGDVNNDGNIDVSDATLIQMKAAGLSDFTEAQKKAGDINGDNQIDITDVTLVQMKAANLYVSYFEA